MKKLIVWCLALALIVLATPALSEASEFDFSPDDALIKGYTGTQAQVVVPGQIDGVDVFGIDRQAFMRSETITSLTIPEPVAVIDDAAIGSMSALTSVTLPDTLQFIGSGNFMDCEALTEITVPPRVLAIEQDCFKWCSSLSSITFTGPVPHISGGCFRSLADNCVVYVPGDQLDAYREALPSDLVIEPSGQNAPIEAPEADPSLFEFDAETGAITGYLGSAPRVEIPDAIDGIPVKAIGKRAFYENKRLFQVSIPDGVETIGEDAFRSAERLVSISVPDSVREIGDYAFYYGYIGEQFPWPESIESIGKNAFASAWFSGMIEFPEGLQTVGESAFNNAKIDELVLPSTLTEIGSKAFRYTGVKTIVFGSTPELTEDAFEKTRPERVTLPANATKETLETYTAYFKALNDACEVVLSEPLITAEDIERYGGLWYLNTIEQDGLSLSAADMGLEITMELYDDGTSVLNSGEPQNGTWSVSDDVMTLSIPDDSDLDFVETDGLLSASQDGTTMVFGREPAQPGYRPGAPIQAATADELNGTWNLTFISIYDMVLPAAAVEDTLDEMLGMSAMVLEIRAPQVRFAGSDEILEAGFENGALTMNLSGETRLQLLEDGALAFEINGGTLYYEKVSPDSTIPEPTPEPTMEPTPEPTEVPTDEPTGVPTVEPTEAPRQEPVIEAAPVSDDCFAMYGGQWFVTAIEMDGARYDASQMGFSATLQLMQDGTASLDSQGDTLMGAWSQTEAGASLYMEGNGLIEMTLTEDGQLYLKQDGMGMIFSREAGEVPHVPQTVEAGALSDFNGTWRATLLEAYGMLKPLDETSPAELATLIDMKDINMTISDGSVTAFGDAPIQYEFDGGMLIKDDDVAEGVDPTFFRRTIALCEGDQIAYTIYGLTFYCERADAQPENPKEPQPETQATIPEMGKTYTCTKAQVRSSQLALDRLGGGYSVTFYEDHTAQVELCGEVLRGLSWTQTENVISVNYLNAGQLQFKIEGQELNMLYGETLNLTFEG